jgi:hypothetical protein
VARRSLHKGVPGYRPLGCHIIARLRSYPHTCTERWSRVPTSHARVPTFPSHFSYFDYWSTPPCQQGNAPLPWHETPYLGQQRDSSCRRAENSPSFVGIGLRAAQISLYHGDGATPYTMVRVIRRSRTGCILTEPPIDLLFSTHLCRLMVMSNSWKGRWSPVRCSSV